MKIYIPIINGTAKMPIKCFTHCWLMYYSYCIDPIVFLTLILCQNPIETEAFRVTCDTEGWISLPDFAACIRFSKKKYSYSQTLERCSSRIDHTEVISVWDRSINTLVANQAKKVKSPLYIGLTTNINQSTWRLNDRPPIYTNWVDVETDETKKKCTVVGSNGKWRDVDCGQQYYYACMEQSNSPCRKEFIPNPRSGMCLHVSTSMFSWEEARAYCKDLDGDLLRSLNHSQDAFLWGQVKNYYPDAMKWIGLIDRSGAGNFKYLDFSTEVNHTNWVSGEPKPQTRPGDRCVFLKADQGKWSTADCEEKGYAVCESFTRNCEYDHGRCEQSCSSHCKPSTCDPVSGLCLCLTGYTGRTCKVCDQGFYGQDCRLKCNTNCAGEINDCDNRNGSCLWGCEPGFYGVECELPCRSGTYGHGCKSACGNCLKAVCDDKTGECPSHACKPGYKGKKCKMECPEGSWGLNCSEKCNNLCGGKNNACNHVKGNCLHGCDAGYQGDKCDSPCKFGTYGVNCSQDCSIYCFGAYKDCDRTDGHCVYGCSEGYMGRLCNQECAAGFYGSGCNKSCSIHCKSSDRSCDKTSGRCFDGCNPGYTGDLCDKDCPVSTYGAFCLEACSLYCKGAKRACDKVTGVCENGCVVGYQGKLCKDEALTELLSSSKYVGIGFFFFLVNIVLVGFAFVLLSGNRTKDDDMELEAAPPIEKSLSSGEPSSSSGEMDEVESFNAFGPVEDFDAMAEKGHRRSRAADRLSTGDYYGEEDYGDLEESEYFANDLEESEYLDNEYWDEFYGQDYGEGEDWDFDTGGYYPEEPTFSETFLE